MTPSLFDSESATVESSAPNTFDARRGFTRWDPARPNVIGTAPIDGLTLDLSMSERAPAADRTLDVREIDGPPFEDITSALSALGTDETLLLVNGFEPEPLYEVLEERGFTYETSRVADDEWYVLIEHA